MKKRKHAKVRNPQYARQAIVTKYHGPGNTRGARIIARAVAGRVSVSADNMSAVDDSHARAAKALDAKFGWTQEYAHGVLPDGRHVFVAIHTDNV